jgi:diguanylate cyclase (GGDEF)-like protein
MLGAVLAWLKRSIARRVAVYAAVIAAAVSTLIGLAIVGLYLSDDPPDVRHEMMLVAIAGGAGTVASVMIGTWIVVTRVLGRSLRDLTDVVDAAAQGRYLARARGSKRTDELGTLMRAFDSLCAQITDLSVAVIDGDRELDWSRRELKLKDALAVLFELTQSVNAEIDLDSIVRRIPSQIAPALGYDEMAILLTDERKGVLAVRSTYGFASDDVVGMTFDRHEGITGIVADGGTPLVIADTSKDERYLHYKGRHLSDGSFACVPLELHGRLVGLFNVLRPRAGSITDGDVKLLRSLASYTALAISHAEATIQLRELSVTDELTGVANRRLLMERLTREIDRARRGERPLTALMLDLDHFKRVNDELGHAAGDQVLRAVARAVLDGVRRVDTVGRYGGEEFVVLLPEVSKAQGLTVAEKLRTTVHDLEPGGIRLTVSIGVAAFPQDATNGAELVEAADRALFAAKRSGRDRVVAFEREQVAQAEN